jgi:hypothetical protein
VAGLVWLAIAVAEGLRRAGGLAGWSAGGSPAVRVTIHRRSCGAPSGTDDRLSVLNRGQTTSISSTWISTSSTSDLDIIDLDDDIVDLGPRHHRPGRRYRPLKRLLRRSWTLISSIRTSG